MQLSSTQTMFMYIVTVGLQKKTVIISEKQTMKPVLRKAYFSLHSYFNMFYYIHTR